MFQKMNTKAIFLAVPDKRLSVIMTALPNAVVNSYHCVKLGFWQNIERAGFSRKNLFLGIKGPISFLDFYIKFYLTFLQEISLIESSFDIIQCK